MFSLHFPFISFFCSIFRKISILLLKLFHQYYKNVYSLSILFFYHPVMFHGSTIFPISLSTLIIIYFYFSYCLSILEPVLEHELTCFLLGITLSKHLSFLSSTNSSIPFIYSKNSISFLCCFLFLMLNTFLLVLYFLVYYL